MVACCSHRAIPHDAQHDGKRQECSEPSSIVSSRGTLSNPTHLPFLLALHRGPIYGCRPDISQNIFLHGTEGSLKQSALDVCLPSDLSGGFLDAVLSMFFCIQKNTSPMTPSKAIVSVFVGAFGRGSALGGPPQLSLWHTAAHLLCAAFQCPYAGQALPKQ